LDLKRDVERAPGCGLDSSLTLNQIDNEDDQRNYEQKVDQTSADVANKAKQPKHNQNNNYSPEHR
jgi:hypothetical protein